MYRKIVNKIKDINTKYNYEERFNEFERCIKPFGFSYDIALEKLNKTLVTNGLPKFSDSGNMSSNHWLIFSGISTLDFSNKINKVLEIGTYDAITSRILALLFPNSDIITIDLPSNDPNFQNFYGRQEVLLEFLEKRDAIINQFENIKFQELNSFKLTEIKNDDYGLIWVDGAHGYPYVTSDIINSYRLLMPFGYLMVDDVINQQYNNDEMYLSIGALRTLREMENLGFFEKIEYPLKRIKPVSGSRLINNKNICLAQKKLRPITNL